MTASVVIPPAARADPRRPDPAAAAASAALARALLVLPLARARSCLAGAGRRGACGLRSSATSSRSSRATRCRACSRPSSRSWPSPAGCSRSTRTAWSSLPAAFCYAGTAIGVVFAGDLVTVFVFWELMAIASTLVIWSAGPSARGAGLRYAAIHLLGGVLLMAGIAGEIAATGSLAFGRHGARLAAALADPRRLSGQCRRAAALGLAARCLSRELVERHGVPVGLHHQDRGLRAAARLPRHRAADLCRPVHGVLRDRLRDPRERHAAHPRLQHRQPGRLHGGRHRHRHRDGAQRRRRARLRPHHLQGAAADVGGLGALHDRQAQMHRSRRPVPHHAAHDHLRHRRRAVDLGVSADVGLRLQVDDLGRPPACSTSNSSGTCSPRPRPASSCMPASSFRGSSSFRRIRACGRPTRRGTCAPP